MKRVVALIGEAEVFHIATVDGDKPRVRPFGFIMDFEDKIYFTTGNKKDFYKQLQKNPNVEISTMLADGSWIRLAGKAVFDASPAAKKKAFEIYPGFNELYQSSENPTFEVFYLENPTATVYAFGKEPEKIL